MASNLHLTTQERNELEKYIRFFIIKAVQIVVQSRLGQRIHHKCKIVSAGSDWFYIGVHDNSEVLTETRKYLSQVKTLAAHSINVEVSLKTKEGENMVLEVWTASMDPSRRESVKICFTVYARLSKLLRSLVCAMRVTYGYKLSRSQSFDSYVICYRVYTGPPDISRMDSPTKPAEAINIGSVGTPMGTIRLKAVCRSQLLFSPTNSCQDLNLKENYFSTEPSSTNINKLGIPLGNRHLNSQEGLDEDITDGRPTVATSPPGGDYEFIGRASPIAPKLSAKNESGSGKGSPKEKMFRLGISSSDNTDSSGSGHPIRTPDRTRRMGAFVPRRASQISLEEEVPFSLLLEMSHHSSMEPAFPSHSPASSTDDKPNELISTSLLDDADFTEYWERPNDFVIIDVKTPFAARDAEDDLGRFYKSCQSRPDLSLVHTGPTISDTLQQLNLDTFEKEQADFDDFCSQLEVRPELPTDPTGSPV